MGPTGRLVTIKRSGLDGPHFPLSLSTCLFGRGIECDIRIQLPVVSKQHCKIEVNDQKAVLFNFSATNPTQVNGSAIDGPVQLRHGDVITVIDRSFRYESDSHQNGSKATEFPGQRREQASPSWVSRSSFSSNPDGKVQDPSAACSQVTEQGGSGGPLERREHVRATRTPSRGSEGPTTKGTADVGSSEPPGDNHGNAAGPPAGGFGAGSCVTPLSWNGGQGLEKDRENESPFRKLYESMKEELDVKEAVLQNRRKSGARGHRASDAGSTGGSQSATQPRVSPKSRRRSGRSSQTEAERAGEGPAHTLEATASPTIPPTEMTKAKTPVQCSQPNSSRRRRSGDLSVTPGGEPVSLQQSKDLGAGSAASAPRRLSARQQTPAKGESAGDLGNTAEKVFSRKRRRSLSPSVGILTTGTDIPKQTLLSPLLVPAERKVPGRALGTPRQQGTPGSPGLGALDVSNVGDSLHKTEGKPFKRRRVSFGGHLRPELFDENLPPNTPLKRGETPMTRRSLVTHTPPVLKKIIKEQPPPSEKGGSSEIRLEVTTQNRFTSSPVHSPPKTSPLANDGRRRSLKSPASSGSKSPHRTDAPQRGGRRSSSGPARRASVDRSQHGILQTIQSRRRSGASEANLMVARSWADVVKLCAKQTQTKVVRHGPPRPPSKRQRRMNTPKKPLGSVHNEFSTGHAASPCTIVIGKAHIEKVTVPARPYRMLNNFVINKKIDFSEDLSGLTEMFKTPAKEKPQTINIGPTTFSNSEDLLGKKFQALNSEEKALLCTPGKFGENVFLGAQNAPEEPWDKQSSSPALTQQYVTVNGNMKTPRSETEPPKAASSTNKSRRSVELRNIQVTSTECEKDDKEVDTVQNILGRCLRKSSVQAQLPEGEMKERERSFETCKKYIEPKENSEKLITVRRSRRSSELQCTPRAGLIRIQRLQETESKEDLEGIHSFLQNPRHAEEPVGTEAKTILLHCKSPPPVSTPTKVNTRIKTPSQRVNVKDLSDLKKPTQTPGDTTDTQKEPVGGNKSMKEFKEAPEQKLDSSENVTRSRRRSRTPKRKVQPIEDLTGFKELFQTPIHIAETVIDDKTTKTPCRSPKPEPVSTPTSTKRRFRTPLGKVDVEEELSSLRKPTPRGNHTLAQRARRYDKGIKAFKETPKQKLDSAENVIGSRRSRTPDHMMESLTVDKTTKTPCRSPKPEPVSTPTSTKRRSRTPLGKADVVDELSSLRKPTPDQGKPHSHREPEGEDKGITAFKETPEQKLDSAENVIGSRRRSRTPKRKVQPIEDLTGFKELFQTPIHITETVTDDKITKTPCKSPNSKLVITPTSSKRCFRTPLGKVDLQEALSALSKPTLRPGEATHSHKEPEGDGKSTELFKETPKQELDSAENVTGSRRRSKTPKRKVQPMEDLGGFKELFQTPIHIAETVTDGKIAKTPCKSPKSEPVSTPTSTKRRFRTPLGKVDVEEELSSLRKPTPRPRETTQSHREPEGEDKGITAFKETPKQKLDSAENVIGSRRSRTPKRKVQPIEDLTGFKELFQTPIHITETVTDDKITKTPCKSPKPEPVITPTSSKRCFRTPLGEVDVQDALSALSKPTLRPGEATHSHKEPEGDDKGIKAFKETPKQKLDSAENVIGSRRRSRTPKRRVQPIEDLAGFKELFQTPDPIMGAVTDDKITKPPCKSPEPEPVITPASTKRHSRTLLGKVDVKEELSSLRKPTPGETTHSHREPEGEDKGITAFKETPKQKLDSAENVIGSRRRSRTPKRKVQPIEDLTGFKELFQTPDQIMGAVTDDKITKTPCKSPKPEPVITPTSTKRHSRTPLGKVDVEEELSSLRKPTPRPRETTQSHREPEGEDKGITAFKETPEQKLDSAENVTGSRRRSRTPKRRVQPIEDLVGFKELFHTPDHIMESFTVDKTTKIPCKYQNPEPVIMLTGRNRRVKAPQGKVVVEDEVSALRRPTRALGKTTRSHRAPEVADKDTKVFMEIPEEKSDPAENVTESKRRPRARKEKAQPLEDLAGLKDKPETVVKTTEMPSRAPQPEAVMPVRRKRQVKAPPGNVDMEEELSAPRKPTRTSVKTTRSCRAPEVADKDTKVFMEIPEEKSDPAENVTESKRRLRTRKEKAQPLEDLAGLKEPFQIPSHREESVTVVKTTEMPSRSPQPEAVLPARRKRQVKAPPGKVDMEEELSAPRKPTRTSEKTTRSCRAPEVPDKDIKLLREIPEEKSDPAENVTESKRRPRARKEKAQPLEDLAGLKDEPETVVETTEMPSRSPQPEAVMPARRKRQVKAPPGNVDMEEELSAPRKPTRTSVKTTRSCRAPEVPDKDIKLLKEIPEEKSDPAENVTESKRRRKVQPMEDLVGFKELFQTPIHIAETVTDDKIAKTPCKSPKSEPVSTPTSTKRRSRTPLGKVDVEEELSSLRKPTPRPRETTQSHREPEGEDKGITAFKETPEQKPDSAENVTGSRRRSRTPKRRVQPIEDLVGFKELFHTPDHIMESFTVDKTTKIPCKYQNPEPVIMLTGRNRRVKAPQGKVVVEDEVSALRRPTRALGKTTRSHRAPEVADKDTKVFMEIPEEKSDPAENVTESKRRPRTRKEKAQPLEDLAGLKDEPETVVKTTEMSSRSPQPEAVMPARRKRQVKAPPGKVDMEEELSAPRTSGKTTRSHREPVDVKVFKESPRQKLGPAENTEGSKRQLRSRKGKAQPPEDPACCQQPLQSSVQDEELGIGAESVRTPTQAPGQSKPAKPRRVLWALDVKPEEDQVGSRDPVKSKRGSSVSLPPKRKREDGSPTRMRRLRTSTRAQDPAEKPPLKRQRAAPQERCEPPEPLGVKKRRGALAESTEDMPSEDMKTKNRGRRAPGATSPGKEMSLRSRLPNKASSAEQTPEGLLTVDKVKTKRSGKKPVTASPEAESQTPEDGARSSASGDTVRERRTRQRPGRQGKAPLPSAAGETSVETHVKTREERGAQRAASTHVRSRKVTVPPTGDTSESQPKPRVTRSAKRPAEKSQQENDDVGVKKIRTRSRRGRDDV
ncbi:PREDICTED: LOW QUALITY PROTEIN: antigen KI-67 [Myotis davidii]|uniref:LOW QUALITY PROTEIN: antigen KI-67 n=1 Tax=Myotis davidii TaxID=225400 RepID=UPI0007674F01|nr:PREDICTED: LOW QUALITY PROTEIN: antigen KI-67 [Myotis davidii]